MKCHNRGVGGPTDQILIRFRRDRFVGEAISQSVVLETVKRPGSPMSGRFRAFIQISRQLQIDTSNEHFKVKPGGLMRALRAT